MLLLKKIISLLKTKKYQNNSYINKSNSKIKYEYSPESVNYFSINNYVYRRESRNANIYWEIINGNISNKITDKNHIKSLEEKIKNI